MLGIICMSNSLLLSVASFISRKLYKQPCSLFQVDPVFRDFEGMGGWLGHLLGWRFMTPYLCLLRGGAHTLR